MKRFYWMFICSVVYLSIAACSPDASDSKTDSNAGSAGAKQAESAATPTPEPEYLSTQDLEAIHSYGTLRLLAPRFDGVDALPREGLSVSVYQQLAEQFAASQGMEVKWVYLDSFDELIPALNAGRGDLVVTNMTVTGARKKEVTFSRAVAQVAEHVVMRKAQANKAAPKDEQFSLALPKGTAYWETLEKKPLETLASELSLPEDSTIVTKELPGNTSDSNVLTAVSKGDYDATMIDSDVARSLLPSFPDLDIALDVNKNRPIAWPVRKQNPKLLRQLNEFLVAHHVKTTSNVNDLRNWATIQKSGQLRILTLNNPASYFIWRGELMGFDYEIANKFAKDNKLNLSVIVKGSIAELFAALRAGEGDMIAASITHTPEREASDIRFTRPYLKVSEQLVGRSDGPKVTSFEELKGYNIGLNSNTVFYPRVVSQADNHQDINVVTVDNATTEALISRLGTGDFEFTVADSHLIALEQSYHDNVHVNFELKEKSPISFVIREGEDQLLEKLNVFIKKEYRGLFYNVVFNKYFKNKKKIVRYQEGRITDGNLSPYDEQIKAQARQFNMDWRLIVAQMYQESKFNPKAKSFAGAQGLMQVMPRTAQEFGFANLYEPENGIAAGVAYMNWLEKRFPGELDFQERIYFTLAAYNAGTGHVRDARRLARQLGLDPNKWFDHVEKAMLKLSQPKYYKNARFGYVRGSEPVTYVRKIRERYLAYLATNL